MNILFVCSANRDRSRTAEIYFQNKYIEHRFRSCGTNKFLSQRHGGVVMERYMLDIAHRIICAEQNHMDLIIERFGEQYKNKIEVLSLGDTKTFMDPELITMLETLFKL